MAVMCIGYSLVVIVIAVMCIGYSHVVIVIAVMCIVYSLVVICGFDGHCLFALYLWLLCTLSFGFVYLWLWCTLLIPCLFTCSCNVHCLLAA